MNLYEAIDIDSLEREFSINKIIPEKYEKVILPALAHYPELLNTHITFMIAQASYQFLRTDARTASIFLSRHRRRYEVKILEGPDDGRYGILLKKLTPEAQIGAIARELALIELCNTSGQTYLVRQILHSMHRKLNKELEFKVDRSVIRHGLSMQLLEYSKQIRSMPGRTPVHKPHLTSEEITLLRNQQLGL
jgi:hypothetical protein